MVCSSAESSVHTMNGWGDKAIEVRARLVPRFLWTTASIDVFLDGNVIPQGILTIKSKGVGFSCTPTRSMG